MRICAYREIYRYIDMDSLAFFTERPKSRPEEQQANLKPRLDFHSKEPSLLGEIADSRAGTGSLCF